MELFNIRNLPPCAIEFPLEISPEEIVGLASPVNTLLKTSYLLEDSLETDVPFQSLFDIAVEIAGVETCGMLLLPETPNGIWEVGAIRSIDLPPEPDRFPFLIAPGELTLHYEKPVFLDSESSPAFLQICETWGSRSLVSFPLRKGREIIGALVFGKKSSHPFTRVQIKLLWVLGLQAETRLYRRVPVEAQPLYSFHDPLTHLYNNKFFEMQLEREILRARRNGGSFGLLLIDLDGFRTYNEKFLHTVGDMALQEFAGILSESVREVDTVARLNVDEFGVILPEGGTDSTRALADRINKRIKSHLLPGIGMERTERLSASIGLASFPADCFDSMGLLRKAELALSTAKQRGGGIVCTTLDTVDGSRENTPSVDIPHWKIYDASRSVMNMDKFLEILLFTGMQGLSAGRGSIVVKEAGGEYSLCAAIGFSPQEEHLTSSRLIRPGPITDWVVGHQIPLVVSRREDSPFPLPPKNNGYHTESFLSIPLVFQGKTLGALHLTNRKDGQPFTRNDLMIFSPISSEIASILSQGIGFLEHVRVFSLSILSSLSNALELRFPFLSGHSDRVRDLSLRIGERMGMDAGELAALRHAAGLHDIGILGVPSYILAKPRRLNDREMEMVQKHSFLGSKMLEGIPGMEQTCRAILEHHEHFDGSGYPHGLRGDDISLPARILSVVECYDALVTERPYRSCLTPQEALQLVRSSGNTRFDPEVATLLDKEMSISS